MAGGLWVLSACVSNPEFARQGEALSSCQTDLRTCQEQAAVYRASCTAAHRKTAEQFVAEQKELETCREAAAKVREYSDLLKTREQELRERLKNELESRDVEISRLRDQLSVRVLDNILFRSGSAEILPNGLKVLDKLASVLLKTDDRIRIEGHTDNVPIGEKLRSRYFSNWELSGARAASVVRYFQHHHRFDPQRLEAVAFGEHRPVAANDSAANRQRNRRVEITLTARRPPEKAAAAGP